MSPQRSLKTMGLMMLVPLSFIGLLTGGLYLDGIITRRMYVQPKSFTGRVLDQDTGRPIEGASVYAYWETDRTLNPLERLISFAGHDAHQYLGDTLVYTDADGRYTLPPTRIGRWVQWRASEPYGEVLIYKKGYVGYSDLRRFDGQKMEGPGDPRADRRRKGNIIRLKAWDESYSHRRHADFLGLADARRGKCYPEYEASYRWESEPPDSAPPP